MFLSYKKKTALIIIGAVFFIILDRFLKTLALSDIYSTNLLGNFLKFNFVKNYNIAFSLPLGGQLLVWFILVVIIGLVYNFVYLYKKRELTSASFILIIIFGASSNVFDRIKYGFVIDYLDFKYFTVFNIADALVVLGAFMLFLFIIKNNKKY